MSLDLDPNHIFRDFVTDGIPASGRHDPRKAEIRQHLSSIWQAVIALLADADPGLALPNLLIRYTVTGGTADAIIAAPNLTPPSGPGLALFSIQIVQTNTGPVTINGKPLLSNSGNLIAAGGLIAGGLYLFLDAGDAFRLVSDQASAAITAAAEAAQLAAEEAQAAAESAAGANLSNIDSRAAASLTNFPSVVNYVRTAGYAVPGDGGGALYRRSPSEPTHNGKFQSADGAWWSITDGRLSVKMLGAIGDGAASDAAAIQSTIDAAAVIGASVVIPTGTYLLGSGLTGRSNVQIEGIGYPVLKSAPGANHTMLVFTGRTRFSVRGIVFDNNRDNQTAGNGIAVVSSSDFDLYHNVILNVFNVGILIDVGSANVEEGTVRYNRLANLGGHGIALSGDGTKGAGLKPRKITIAGNRILDPGQSGVNVSEAHYVTVTANVVDHTNRDPANGYGGVRVTNNATGVTITGNTVKGMPRGIFLLESSRCTVTGNVLDRVGRQGIYMESATGPCAYHAVMGNVIINPGQDGASYGIQLIDTTLCTITGNSIVSADGKMDRGIIRTGAGMGKNTIHSNSVDGSLTGDITSTNVEDSLSHNTGGQGDDDITSASTIILPATGDLFNITGTAAIVNINGGWRGRMVTLRFAATASVTDGTNVRLAGNFTGAASATLTLIYMPNAWYEVARSLN